MKNILKQRKVWPAIMFLLILSIIGMVYLPHLGGQLRGAKAETIQSTLTLEAAAEQTSPLVIDKEPDVTIGIVLAGSLLMLVIISGTLFATRRIKKPPQNT